MLVELVVRQFALIERAGLSLAGGTTVFSGETGAGKSLLVDALGAVFGSRASSDWVRHGADRAEVTATLEVDDDRLTDLLEAQEIDPEDQLILRRVVSADGRSRAYVNGVPAPAKLLREIGRVCLDLHGQHEHQALLDSGFQRRVLDARIDAALLDEVARAHRDWREARERLVQLRSERDDTARQEEWLREELARLEALAPEPGLEARLREEVEAGRHHAQIQEAAAEALALLDGEEGSARELIARAGRAVGGAADYHAALAEGAGLVDQMDALLGELAARLNDALDASFDADALAAAEERLMSLHEAMRRHNVDEPGLLALAEEWRAKVERAETAGWDETALARDLERAREGYVAAADRLTAARREAAEALTAELRPYLDRLGLEGMRPEIEVTPAETESGWYAHGRDAVTFTAASNPGEPVRPLANIASGGELSRLALALKGCGAMAQAPHVAVFDEVDVGIGGETAWSVGELLAAMGRERQVLVVSHLPQVAACADQQVRISKQVSGERTVTELEALAPEARREEIARMLGGAGRESLEHAGRMLERARG